MKRLPRCNTLYWTVCFGETLFHHVFYIVHVYPVGPLRHGLDLFYKMTITYYEPKVGRENGQRYIQRVQNEERRMAALS